MTKIDDMVLFVEVVKAGGLAAAGRQLGLSPASMTERIKRLEARYNTRLLNRNTRSISLTDAGNRFYKACTQVVADIAEAEAILQEGKQDYLGQLKVTAPSDFGRQYVAPALAEFVLEHPQVKPYLHLSESMMNLVEDGFDLAIRYGNLPDSNLMIRSLSNTNRRVLCASPAYLKEHGIPKHPKELKHHRCLVMERFGEQLNQWRFQSKQKTITIRVDAAFMGNDGALIRHWALQHCGIALKSIWDVNHDLVEGRLVTVLNDYVVGAYMGDDERVGLQILYPSRQYLPRQVAGFIDYFLEYMAGYGIVDQNRTPTS